LCIRRVHIDLPEFAGHIRNEIRVPVVDGRDAPSSDSVIDP
jgi:hypothetical protein